MWGPSFSKTRLGFALLMFAAGCARSEAAPMVSTLRVAAAADLALAFKEVGAAYEKETGQKVIFSFGSTGLLAKQIEEGAPFDVFAAANASFADDAIKAGACLDDSRSMYARGRIVLWSKKAPPKTAAQLADPKYVKVAIANPGHAPYGQAAMQAIARAGVKDAVKPKLVYGENVQQTLQFAQSGNAEVAVVALSLAVISDGEYTVIPQGEHLPIDQQLVVCGKDATRQKAARAFASYVNSASGRTIMRRFGFLLPGEKQAKTL